MYLTFKLHRKKNETQIDLFKSILNNSDLNLNITDIPYQEYCTVDIASEKETIFNKWQYETLYQELKTFVDSLNLPKYRALLTEGLNNQYTTFKIPKASGGFRTIDAPSDALKDLLRSIKNLLQNTCQIHPHNAAYAYTPGRCARHAIEKHQYNQSKHFLHIDLKDFFTSCDAPFIHHQLKQIYPFCKIYKEKDGPILMDILVNFALYNGRLPQGTPLSPYLTNIIMIPIDYAISNLCRQRNKQHFVYTRYADDIDISSKYDFNYLELVREIELILAQNSPLKINKKKIHYGTAAGRNWHLGLMLNGNNQITIGHKKKREIKTLLLNFCKSKDSWTKEDMQSFHGELAYFRSIEPEYHDYLIETYSQKYNNSKDIIQELRDNIK